jgi:L-alanine-DL-glutamate epimerase-like enolase superfamily enzyme
VPDPIVEVTAVTTRLELPRPIVLGTMRIASRAYAVVTVRTESGLEGNAFALSRDAPVAAVVQQQLAPVLVGRDSDLVAARFDECFRATVASGRVGVVLRALSLVDVALWDVKGKRAGLPLWRLLGGNAPEVPAMVVGGYPTGEPPEELAARVGEYGRDGWPLVKLARVGDHAVMRRLVDASLAAIPDGTRLVVDAAWSWRRPDEVVRELEAWGDPPLAWLEDPLPTEDVEAYRKLAGCSSAPIGAGDEITDPHLLRAHLAADTLDVLRVDATTIGGVSGAQRLMQAAAAAAVPVSCHVYPELHVHLAAANADGATVETFDGRDNPFDPAARLYSGGPEWRPGLAVAPETPGLGIELDRELIEAHRVANA